MHHALRSVTVHLRNDSIDSLLHHKQKLKTNKRVEKGIGQGIAPPPVLPACLHCHRHSQFPAPPADRLPKTFALTECVVLLLLLDLHISPRPSHCERPQVGKRNLVAVQVSMVSHASLCCGRPLLSYPPRAQSIRVSE